jgi:hypothetical protein
MSQAHAGQTYLANYCQRLLLLGVSLTLNHHIAMHFASMIKFFGPVYAWWLFAFERFNGMLEKVKNNGHDGGKIELTMLRHWVQTHLVYELLLGLPAEASQHERNLLNRLINTEASRERGTMMTELAIFRSEASIDSISLPRTLPKPTDLHKTSPYGLQADLYTLLFEYCRDLWPGLQLRQELSSGPGITFLGSQVARRLPYIRKDGLRYGSAANMRTSSDISAFINYHGVRTPVQIDELFVVQVAATQMPPHVCAVVRRFRSDDHIPPMPWDL